MTPDTTALRERLTYDEAEKLALQAIHDSDGRGMVGRGRNHLHQRVARAILDARRAALLSSAEAREEAVGTERWMRWKAEEAQEAAEFLLALALACCEEHNLNYEDRAAAYESAAEDWRQASAALQAAETRAQQAEARVGELEKALLRIAERDWHYRTPPKPKPDGGMRGWAGHIAVFALTGLNGSMNGDEKVRKALAARQALQQGEGQ